MPTKALRAALTVSRAGWVPPVKISVQMALKSLWIVATVFVSRASLGEGAMLSVWITASVSVINACVTHCLAGEALFVKFPDVQVLMERTAVDMASVTAPNTSVCVTQVSPVRRNTLVHGSSELTYLLSLLCKYKVRFRLTVKFELVKVRLSTTSGLYQLKVDVGMLNTVKNCLADV